MTKGNCQQAATTPQRFPQVQRADQTTCHRLIQVIMALTKLRKFELKAKLLELGEETPAKWTNKEIIMRILELDPTANQTARGNRTDLQERIKALGVASKKKTTLQEFCREIGVDFSVNHTKHTLEQHALRKLYDLSKPAAEDIVGFGRHSTETYEEIRTTRVQYAQWVRQTARETEETDYRLRRLANWLEAQDQEEAEMIKDAKTKKSEQGYATTDHTSKASTARSSDSMNTAILQETIGRPGAALRSAEWPGHDFSTTEGIRNLLEKLEQLCPMHVWIQPPVQVFSPWQKANQPETKEGIEHEQKKQQVMRYLVGCGVVIGVCIQKGIHVSLMMPEHNNAWRLPLMQQMLKRHALRTCVTKGCRMNKRGTDHRLSRRGWKICTTHNRLHDLLQAPCMCAKDYEHSREDHQSSQSEEPLTPEFVKRVGQAVLQEHNHISVLQELQGKAELPESFGVGLQCTCEEQIVFRGQDQVLCGMCLTGSQVQAGEGSFQIEGREEHSGLKGLSLEDARFQQSPQSEHDEAHYSRAEVEHAEAVAKRLYEAQKFEPKHCQEVIEALPENPVGGRTQAQAPPDGSKKHGYFAFGLYAHGAFHGITKWTTVLPYCQRYFQQYLKKILPKGQYYTSFVVSRNMHMPLHRDCHNDEQYENCVHGIGPYQGGQLWVEHVGTVPVTKPVSKVLPDGDERVGKIHNTRGQLVRFNPKAWHGTEVWSGERYVLSSYVSRSHTSMDTQCRKQLRDLGFLLPPEKREQIMTVNDRPLTKNERARVQKQLYMLHAATGHGSVRHLCEALRRRGVHPEVLKMASEFQCSVCNEKRQVQPRHLASLEPLPPKWHCVSADIGHYYNSHKKEHVQFMMLVDEGSRFKAAKVLTSGSKQQPTAAACLEYLRDGWITYFGAPRTLRLDPAGAFRGQAVEEFCDRHQIFLDIVPGEAHWKISVVEQAIKGVKELMQKLLTDEPDLDTREALAVSVRTFNQREIIRGFSPAQHALGQGADATGRLDFSGKAPPPELLVENPTGEFQRNVERQKTAEIALVEWQAKQRLSRASHSRGRRVLNFQPGELVFFWRSQVSGQSRREPGDRHGQFLGPARILATETKREDDGLLRPSSSVWLVRGRSLIKCSAEQIRRASAREELVESLSQVEAVPWTYTRVAEEIGGNRYQDVTEQVPEEEWLRAQDVEQEEPPTRHRIRHKRPLEETTEAGSYGRATTSTESPAHGSRNSPYNRGTTERGEQWWNDVEEAMWCDENIYWQQESAAVEVALDMPTTTKGWDQACRDLPTYFLNNIKKRAIEVSEKRLTDEERELFKGAKAVEIKNFVAAKAFETLPEELRPSKSQAVGMRWILTWKQKEDGSVKPKARAVLLGYQDPAYEHRSTTSPVMTRQTRQYVLQLAATRRWQVAKGDVSGAFLQGREYPDKLYCIPCPEICSALGIPADTVTRLRRACYGLVDAPLEWYKTVDEFLGSLNLERTWSDACCWVLRDQGQLVGVISGHVDDFIFAGSEKNVRWQQVLQAIKKRFEWGDWDYDDFVQCGVSIKRTPEGFELSQERYVNTIKEIPVNATRKKQETQTTTEREKSQLRALLGAISWHAQQVAPHLSAEVSLLLSEVAQSTVSTITKANSCLRRARAQKGHAMKIHAFPETEELGLFAWVDAANQNRVDGYSTQGILIGLAPTTMLQGDLCQVTPVAWHSNRIDRACRSPGAAEAHAAINGEDALYFARYQWHELLYGAQDLRAPEQDVKNITGCLITDSRNVYDKLATTVLSIKGAEKRTHIEMIALKESQLQTGLILRWVHSEAQLANPLTKKHNCKEMDLFYHMNHAWKIVEDPEMRSARKRRADGDEPLSSKEGSKRKQ